MKSRSLPGKGSVKVKEGALAYVSTAGIGSNMTSERVRVKKSAGRQSVAVCLLSVNYESLRWPTVESLQEVAVARNADDRPPVRDFSHIQRLREPALSRPAGDALPNQI